MQTPPRASLADVLASHRGAVARALVDSGVVEEAAAGALVDELVEALRRAGPRRARAHGEELDPRLREIVDHAPAAVYVKDRRGRYVFANRWFGALLGREPRQLLGRTAAELFPREIADRIAERERRASAEGEAVTEDAYPTPHGERTLMTVRFPFRLRAGEAGLFVLAFDVTERERAKAEAEQARERLRAANARLLEADRRKDDFLGMLSHELRNPLAPIRNSIYILNHGDPTPEQAARARGVIERQTDHLARIVDDLLDVTRIARGKIELRRERADVAAVVRRAAEDHRAVATERRLSLVVEAPDAPLWALVDATRVAQIVGNLVSNAIKFTPADGTITVSVRAEGGRCVLRVRDTGIGIVAEVLPLVFDPFVQGEHSLARTDGGLGLGLALVKGLAELHGGTAAVSSDGPGKGALFTVTLPAGEQPVADRPGAGAAAAPGQARKVLVVEDSRDAAESMADLLRLFGHEAALASDGAEAVRMAQADPPDVVLCDIGLPGIDGYEVARRLRADPALRAVRLVAVSGYAQPEDLARSRAAGFERHISKPPDPEEIRRAIVG